LAQAIGSGRELSCVLFQPVLPLPMLGTGMQSRLASSGVYLSG